MFHAVLLLVTVAVLVDPLKSDKACIEKLVARIREACIKCITQDHSGGYLFKGSSESLGYGGLMGLKGANKPPPLATQCCKGTSEPSCHQDDIRAVCCDRKTVLFSRLMSLAPQLFLY